MVQKITPESVIQQINTLIKTGVESGNEPFAVFDIDSAIERVEQFHQDSLKIFKAVTIAYSYKSNNLSQWCQVLCNKGLSAEVCSADELRLAIKDGFKNIFFDGPLKTYQELEFAIKENVIIDIDNINELNIIQEICEEKETKARILIRLSHYYDENLSRFGLTEEEFLTLAGSESWTSQWIIFCGFHLHVGSNLASPQKICDSILLYKDLLNKFMPEKGILNLGSGIPADSFTADNKIERPQPLSFFEAIRSVLNEHIESDFDKWHVVFEPGRHFVEDFGYFIGRISSLKDRYNASVAQTNLGINWIPSVRNWHHSFQLLLADADNSQQDSTESIIAGFNCFECDCLFPSILLPKAVANPLFIIKGCGAYDIQTNNEWTRRLYPIYSIKNGKLDIARIHRTPSDFRSYDVSLSSQTLQVDEELALHTPDLTHAYPLFNLIIKNKVFFENYMAWPKYVNNIQDSVSFIEKSRIKNQEASELVLLILYKKELCGVISFNTIDWNNKTATIGYWLGHEFQHKGIITRSLNMLIDEYRKNGSITRFVIKCVSTNLQSNNVAIRSGFTLEGVQIKAEILNGVAYDQNLYAKVF